LAIQEPPHYGVTSTTSPSTGVHLEHGDLNVELPGHAFAWPDTGGHESFLEAAQ